MLACPLLAEAALAQRCPRAITPRQGRNQTPQNKTRGRAGARRQAGPPTGPGRPAAGAAGPPLRPRPSGPGRSLSGARSGRGRAVGGRRGGAQREAMAAGSAIQIPSRLPLLLTHEGVLLPGSTMRTSVDSPRNMQLVRSRLLKGTSLRSTIIGVIPNTSDPTSDCDDLPNLHRWRAGPWGRGSAARPPGGSLSPPRSFSGGVAVAGTGGRRLPESWEGETGVRESSAVR